MIATARSAQALVDQAGLIRRLACSCPTCLTFKSSYDSRTSFVVYFWQSERALQFAVSNGLEHHPHVHALVPGAAPSLDGTTWVPCRMITGTIHDKPVPFLVDNKRLGWRFRDKSLGGSVLSESSSLGILHSLTSIPSKTVVQSAFSIPCENLIT